MGSSASVTNAKKAANGDWHEEEDSVPTGSMTRSAGEHRTSRGGPCCRREEDRRAIHRCIGAAAQQGENCKATSVRQIERISERRKQNELRRTELQWRINEDAENEHELRQLDEELCRRC
jgi:hypothetical protein